MYANLNTGAIGVRADLEQQVHLAAKYGFKGCDIDLAAAERFGIPQTVELFAANNLRMGGFGLPVEYRKDEATFKSGIRELPRWAGIAEELGCHRCTTWVLPGSDENSFDEQFRLLRGRFRDCALIFRDHGIRLGLEFIGPKTLRDQFKHEFIYTLGGMLELAEAIGTGNVGLLLDAWHWYTSGGDTEQLRRLTNDHVVYVHINDAPAGIDRDQQVDNVRALPMETGVIDLPEFLRALDDIDYDGPVTTEPFCAELSKLHADDAVTLVKQSMVRGWDAADVAW